MSAGKLALLLVVGGLAGAAFATLTTGSLPHFSSPEHARSVTIEGSSSHRSWLDEGLSALDSPAWPFGRGAHDREPEHPVPPPDGYAPYGYGAPDDYGDGSWERGQYGGRSAYSGEEYVPAPAPEAPRPAPREDSASDAAARAADAAQDVIAAENAP
ncbi:hypothetical protein [Novosphingobium kaempferiae]|uniref:hypothetical protein n=1 Tax=Novosphingobium kaempferiae TaxID=2896849 RepID=UPI001E507F3A|nr:hypothetical protein [Novosphingobium kaempferiae]